MIYLDYAATTPLDKNVIKAMAPFFDKKYGNPSSIHALGREAKNAILHSRKIWANFFDVSRSNIIFTGSATESNNLAIRGLFRSLKLKHKFHNLESFHAITTLIEHKSVLETFHDLERNEGLKVSYIKPDQRGVVSSANINNAIKKNTVLVSIMYVNNETGAIQPIAEIAKAIKDLRFKIYDLRKRDTKYPLRLVRPAKRVETYASSETSDILNTEYPLIHSDCVQAVQFYNCDLKKLGVDFASASAHKIYGPKGVGVLAARDIQLIEPIITGGWQESGLRAGTENVAGIVGAAKALEIAEKSRKSGLLKITNLKKKLLSGIMKVHDIGTVNGSQNFCAPHILNYCFKGIDAQSLLIYLDLNQIAVSIGSACCAGTIKPSHVLSSIGLSDQDAKNSIRFSLGKYTTENDIKKTLSILKNILRKMRLKDKN